MSVVSRYSGSIYQYLGDGAIVSWKIDKGLRDNNFLKAFFEFGKVIENRGRYYNRKYGFVPKFKAGIHLGKVMVLQVGRIRRDVSYNGDTINTAARIESMCNEYRQNLLISGDLYQQTKNKKEYNFKDIGDIQLKGKRKPVDIYQVKEKPKKRK
jgi:adenylate cyclase